MRLSITFCTINLWKNDVVRSIALMRQKAVQLSKYLGIQDPAANLCNCPRVLGTGQLPDKPTTASSFPLACSQAAPSPSFLREAQEARATEETGEEAPLQGTWILIPYPESSPVMIEGRSNISNGNVFSCLLVVKLYAQRQRIAVNL